MNNNKNEGSGEFPGLAERLGRADFSAESRMKSALKARLLAKAERRGRRTPFLWLLPAAALAAALIMVNVRHKPRPSTAPASSYDLPSDGYGACGRQGLAASGAEGRF